MQSSEFSNFNQPGMTANPDMDAEQGYDAEYARFELEFELLSGIRLELYKEKQMKRRIRTQIARKGFHSYRAFLERLRSDPAELADFIDYITINVTEFFRTPEHWRVMEEELLPGLPACPTEKLKIWSCACASGEEAYSLAMSLCRVMDPSRFTIIASDLDDTILTKAKEGFYPTAETDQIPAELLEHFFVPERSGYRVSPELKACVEFRKLDLLTDDYPRDCDLIVCRNVLIYFTEEAKDLVYRKILGSLKPHGFLFTGNTEQIIYYRNYGLQKIRGFLYRKA